MVGVSGERLATDVVPPLGHGLSLAGRLKVLNETWCPDCPANPGEPCTFVETDRSNFKPNWPIVAGDPIPYFHYQRKQRWYLYLGERPCNSPGATS